MKGMMSGSSRTGPDLDNKHQGASEKGPTETVFPKDPQEEQSSGIKCCLPFYRYTIETVLS